MLELSSKWNFFEYEIQTLNVSSFLKGNKSEKSKVFLQGTMFQKICFNCSETLHFDNAEICCSDKVGKVASSFLLLPYIK